MRSGSEEDDFKAAELAEVPVEANACMLALKVTVLLSAYVDVSAFFTKND